MARIVGQTRLVPRPPPSFPTPAVVTRSWTGTGEPSLNRMRSVTAETVTSGQDDTDHIGGHTITHDSVHPRGSTYSDITTCARALTSQWCGSMPGWAGEGGGWSQSSLSPPEDTRTVHCGLHGHTSTKEVSPARPKNNNNSSYNSPPPPPSLIQQLPHPP